MPEYPPLICGIDPGASGGISFLSMDSSFSIAYPMPTTEWDTCELLSEYQPSIRKACIEAVHAFPGQGVTAMFSFGRNYGFLRGILIALQIPLLEVAPQKWKRDLGLKFTAQDSKKDKKNGSKQLAQQWFPSLKITHATAEALLIAEWGRRRS